MLNLKGSVKLVALATMFLSLVTVGVSAAEGRRFGDPNNSWFFVAVVGGSGEGQNHFSGTEVLSVFLQQTERTWKLPKVELLDIRIQQVTGFVGIPGNGAANTLPLSDAQKNVHQTTRRGIRIEKAGVRIAAIDLKELGLKPGQYRILVRATTTGVVDGSTVDENSAEFPVAEFVIELPPQPEEGGQ